MRRPPVSSDKRLKASQDQVIQYAASDRGPPERWQHDLLQLQRIDAHGTTAARVMTECTLDVLQHKGQVTPKMWQAGIQLRRDYVGAKVETRTVMRYAPTIVRPGRAQGEIYVRSEKEELSYKRWRQALQIVGVGLSEALVTVCCLDHAPSQAQHKRLIDGLAALVRYYKI